MASTEARSRRPDRRHSFAAGNGGLDRPFKPGIVPGRRATALRRMLCSRSWAGRRLTWDAFNQIKERTPLLPPKLRLPYSELQALAVL